MKVTAKKTFKNKRGKEVAEGTVLHVTLDYAKEISEFLEQVPGLNNQKKITKEKNKQREEK